MIRELGADVSQVDLIAYLLTTCASVAEVKASIPQITIWGHDPGMGSAPPTHLLVHDTTSSIAIEFSPDATVSVVDNPTGVGTNAPYLDWHLLNLQNYVGFSGFTPAAQAILVELASQAQTGAQAEQMVGHLLNSFDIVPGTLLEHMGTKVVSDETTYDVIVSLSQLRFTYRTVTDPTWYCLDLASVDFTKPARTQPMSFAGGFTSITA